MNSVAIGLLQLDYSIHNDLEALRIDFAGTPSGTSAQNAYLGTTHVDEADETGRAVLKCVVPPEGGDRGPVELRLPAAGKSALDERARHASASASQSRAEKIGFSDRAQMECELR